MKLQSVLRQHDAQSAPQALKNVLGDAYLLRKNPMYRRTRELARELGFRFVPAWESYQRAPLFELQGILKKKRLPYNDSVPTLRRLVRDHRLNDEMEDVPVNLVSAHFHESAHGISDRLFRTVKPRNKREKILLALLCESYANATESMAIGWIDGDLHRFFFEQNSYIYADAGRIAARRKALRAWGAVGLFRLLWLSYLYSNFLVGNLPRPELEGLLRFALQKAELSRDDRRWGEALFQDAYELNETFRLKTSRLYMRLLSIKGDVRQNLAFDFSEVFLNRPGFHERFQQLAELSARDLAHL
ncbi:MAG: hypothetical protein KF802_04610 [Bdellovibrionaceae bacterium]|nr:hypothetical protein [Pseudobdellovibrionaceae bacterium]